ncbi:MAG: hypothetical protein RSE14_10445 [Erythrobacter sp.]|uniref:hypothetical protein n=1 Tax=Erythrobacter sp. TaxID=1042 RepID=UPI002B47FE01|nr:hypothetical protein [Erythrobacter sp.]WRH69696.1 MAG: hypothetical protein RSE14_10445 [Erythrobacter sp.]
MKVSHPEESKGSWSISGDRIERSYPRKSINLADNVKEIKVRGHSEARDAVAGRDGLPRAAAGAVLGFLIAGPVGTVLGAGAGASGASAGQAGRSESYSVILTFKDFQFLLGDVTPFELEQLRGFLAPPAPLAAHTVESTGGSSAAPKVISNAKPDAYAALPEPIKGRSTKQKPFPISKLTKKLGKPLEAKSVDLFFRHLQVALDSVNTIKWRHYDLEVESDLEMAEIVSVALSATSHQIRQLSSLSGTADEVIELLVAYFAPLVSEDAVRKAWSKPKPSSVIAKAGALKIFKKCRSFDPLPETVSKPEAMKSPNGEASFDADEIERKLINLKSLLDRGVIGDDEYRAARMKTLGI